MDASERTYLGRVLHGRRDAIASAWYDDLHAREFMFAPLSADDVRCRFATLTEQVITVLLAETCESGQARDIGAALARLHYIQPTVLQRTQAVLTQSIMEGLPDTHAAALYPRLVALFGELAAGFFTEARATILAEQEKVREALLAERRRAEAARREVESELAEAQRRLARASEEERLHLTRELHDGPVQDVCGAQAHLEVLKKGVRGVANLARLSTVQETLRQVTATLRAVCQELRPPALDLGLDAAICSHVARFQAAHPEVMVSVDLAPGGRALPEPGGRALPEPARRALFRVYQEVMTNVAHHARASHVLVRLVMDTAQDQVLLEIQDDGRGFTMPERLTELAYQDHLGLLGAAERAEAIGGRLDIVSSPGQGTVIRAAVPLPTCAGLAAGQPRLAQRG